MNRFLIGTFALVSATDAAGADFRSVAIGDSCEDAARAEEELNSEPIEPVDEMLEMGRLVFETTYAGHSTLVSYRCEGRAVVQQLFVVSALTETDAEQVYSQLQTELLDLYGPPCTDWRSLPLGTSVRVWMLSGFSSTFLNAIDWNLDSDVQSSLSIEAWGPDQDDWKIAVATDDLELTVIMPDGSQQVFGGSRECYTNP